MYQTECTSPQFLFVEQAYFSSVEFLTKCKVLFVNVSQPAQTASTFFTYQTTRYLILEEQNMKLRAYTAVTSDRNTKLNLEGHNQKGPYTIMYL
jgi:hypothetical protein